MTIYTSKKNRKIVEPVHNEGIEKEQLVNAIYQRLEPKPIERNRMIAWMRKSKAEGGASFNNVFEADAFIKFMQSRGRQFEFE